MSKALKDVRLSEIEFHDVERDAKLYCVKFKKPLRIQTPVVALVESIANAKGEVLPYAYIKPDKELEAFLNSFDDFVLDQAYEHRDGWFKERPSRRELEDSFKRYFKDGNFRLKVNDAIEVFDTNRQLMRPEDLQTGDPVKVIMELTRISIGKNSYGVIWRCSQVMRQKTRQCLFADDEDDVRVDDDDDYDEFP